VENSFNIGGREFKLRKIDALKQFHVVRRIGPLLSELMPALAGVAKSKAKMESMSEGEKLDEFAKIAQPFMAGLSKLSDSDADYVLFRLLGAVEVHQPQHNSWAKVASDSGIMMQDIELPILLQAAGRALMFNLQGFFASLPRK
jgi:hypothetical protein